MDAFELEKLKLHAPPPAADLATAPNRSYAEAEYPKWELRKLIADQMKRKSPPEVKEHISSINGPLCLQAVFDRLTMFNLDANREKCHFTCSRVKYLGLWITQEGVEATRRS